MAEDLTRAQEISREEALRETYALMPRVIGTDSMDEIMSPRTAQLFFARLAFVKSQETPDEVGGVGQPLSPEAGTAIEQLLPKPDQLSVSHLRTYLLK